MRSKIGVSLFLVLLLSLQALAEDIDLFLGTPPLDSKKPNVLIILDNTANWNTAFVNEKEALVNVFEGLDPTKFNVGLMMFGESPQLGYVKAAIRPMSGVGPDGVKKYNELYAEMIGEFCVSSGRCTETGKPGDGGNARTLARTFSEAHRYLIGGTSVDTSRNAGQGKNGHREFPENDYSTAESTVVHNLPLPALASDSTFRYQPPPDAGACGKTYVIYIGNTLPSGNVTKDNANRNNAAGTELRAAGGDVTTITDGYIIDGTPYNAHIDNYADEWARFMHDTMGVIFYAVDVDPAPYPGGNANGIGNSVLLKSLSQGVGGGKYFAVDSDNSENIKLTLINILNEIQAENSVFSSVALPASTTGQSVFLNQVFIGLFRPDGNAYPRWPGNLKQYKLGKDAGSIKLFDAANELALNTSTGFITDCARSYWTDPDPDGYWKFSPSGTCPPANLTNPSIFDSPDGPYVEKGAQAHRMRKAAPTDRTVFTCDPDLDACDNMDPFDPNTITGATYETLLAADPNGPNILENLVNWAIGVDLDDDNKMSLLDDPDYVADTTETRAWIHGDVIHSRPIAINYGDSVSPKVVVYYGANDGMLRAINGNQSGDIAGHGPGEEFWAFMPPEFYDQIKRLKVNTETVKFPATGPFAGADGTPKAYGMDGPISVMEYDLDGDTAPERYIYAAMRRGGRALYAFDVSDPNDPPELLWKKGCDDTGCSNDDTPVVDGWDDIGQTWSNANVAYLNGRTNPVLIMGGGYDECEDVDAGAGGANHSCGSGSTGDHIYVVDAVTGDLLAVHDTERAVPGGVTLVPITDATNGNPTPDLAFAYATDTGGNVYRISGPLDNNGNATVIGSNEPDTWLITPIAAFGCGPKADAVCSSTQPNRKFLFGADVVRDLEDSMIFRILVGSGDREKPILEYTATSGVDNYFYSFVDKPLASSVWLDVDATCNLDIFCQDLLEEATVNEVVSAAGRDVQIVLPDGVDIAAAPGYAIKLADTEQVVTGALVVGDIANFSTHVPYDSSEDTDDDVCLNKLGTATTYNVNFERAEGEGVDIFTGGLVPTPVAGKVILCEGGICVDEPFCIGCGGENSPIGGGVSGTSSSFEQAKGKVYWNIEQ